ncbi:hypothetical protein D5086_006487 [Populus alba]|uniref:Uncharacterized protein n=1 Tax=Populus alba TaxID=43335 RepID=A0ACC4CLZ0_POPAL
MDVKVTASDKISHLADHIIHQIVSFLPTIDFSVSCPKHGIAFRLHSTYGILRLMLPNVDLYSETVERREKFLNFVHNSLVRQCHQNSSIQRQRLSLTFYCTSGISSLIDSLIVLALQFGVKELDIKAHVPCNYYNDLN